MYRNLQKILKYLLNIFITAFVTAVLISFFTQAPNVVVQTQILNKINADETNNQILESKIENKNILSLIPFFFKITDAKISVDLFTLIQEKRGDGSIFPCYINGTQASSTTLLRYGQDQALFQNFSLEEEKSALLNSKLKDIYNTASYVRVNYSYSYENKLSLSRENFTGTKIYMLFQEATTTFSLLDMYADRDSPLDPINIVRYPTNLVVSAPIRDFSLLMVSKEERKCLNYHIKNYFGPEYRIN